MMTLICSYPEPTRYGLSVEACHVDLTSEGSSHAELIGLRVLADKSLTKQAMATKGHVLMMKYSFQCDQLTSAQVNGSHVKISVQNLG